MASFTALYDACVLYPAPLRDLLMQLALSDLYRAKWSDMIHDEWINSLSAKRPDLERAVLERTRELMNAHVRDCLVTEFEHLIPVFELPDPDDRHVLAAAVKGRADVIVTYNLSDFPEKVLRLEGIEAQHPDEFLCHLVDLSAGSVCSSVKTHRNRLRHPTKSVDEYLETLERQQLTGFVAALREFADLL